MPLMERRRRGAMIDARAMLHGAIVIAGRRS
jgi:hypothetical protein